MFRKGASLFCTICNKYSMEKIEDERAFLFYSLDIAEDRRL